VTNARGADKSGVAVFSPGISVLERGWLSSNNVLLHGTTPAEGAVLVDTGYASHAAQTLALLDTILRPNEALRLILNTHLHSDHCGGNALISQRHGCPILVPPGEYIAASTWDEEVLTFRATGQHCDRFAPAGKLGPGQTLHQAGREWHVHAAPGHDPHAVILHEPSSGTLLSADALWERGFGIVFPELDGEDAFDQVAATLDIIERLNPAVVIPGHGPPFQDVSTAIRIARARVDYFRRQPERHAVHAAKALVAFHMLEVGQSSRAELLGWLTSTPIFISTWSRFFSRRDLLDWAGEVVDQLIEAEVLLATVNEDSVVLRVRSKRPANSS